MKVKKILFFILMFLPLIVTLITLPILPEQIPAHYDFNNQVTRWGSKYEALLYPAATIGFGFFMLAMAKYSAKQEKTGKNNENICIIAGIVLLLYFNVMTGFSLYTDFNRIENLSAVAIDIHQLIWGIAGVCMIVIGNLLPKARMNALVGLRTTWSMTNETVWKKSQRFGGISFILVGIFIIAVSCFVKGVPCTLWSLGILLISLPVDIYYTYKAAKKYRHL